MTNFEKVKIPMKTYGQEVKNKASFSSDNSSSMSEFLRFTILSYGKEGFVFIS